MNPAPPDDTDLSPIGEKSQAERAENSRITWKAS
jgi:hypothetical protein